VLSLHSGVILNREKTVCIIIAEEEKVEVEDRTFIWRLFRKHSTLKR